MKFVKVRPVKSPKKSMGEAAGIDFFVPDDFEETVLSPGESISIPSGIRMAIPTGWAGVFFNRSSVGSQSILIGAQVVDSDYRGEVHLSVCNCSAGTQYIITPGQKLVQMLILPVPHIHLDEVTKEHFLSLPKTTREDRGFGSTGA